MTTNPTPAIWFCPPDVSNQASPAGEQIMDLFSDPAAWQTTASEATGFVLTEDFVLRATDQQLSQVLSYLTQHGLKLMMVAGMIPVQANGGGNGLEGFTSESTLLQAVQRIQSLGGTLDRIAMDGPLGAGHEPTGGPQLSITDLAQQVALSVALVKSVFPNVQFQDDEPVTTSADLSAWTQAFQAATGTPIAAIDADVNWSAPGVTTQLETFAQSVRATGAQFGIIGDSTPAFNTDQSWALAAETNIAAAEANPLLQPSTVLVETWDPNPTSTLPEGQSGTLSHVAVEAAEISPLYASGFLVGGSGVTVTAVAPTPSYVGSAMDAVAGAAIAVPGVALTVAGSSAGMTFAVVVTAETGTLGGTASGSGNVSGEGTDVLLLTGGLADINAELASLTYTGAAAGTDTIDVTTYDGTGLVADDQIAVAIAAPIAVTLPGGISAAALYANIFGAAPSADALAAVQAAMAAGQTLAQAAAPWIAQAQATISSLCEQVQGASPGAATLASLTAEYAAGTSLAEIRVDLANGASVQAEMAALYQNHYGASPTAAQLAALTEQLAGGASLQVVEAPLLANSQADSQIANLYQQVEGQVPDAIDLATPARALSMGTSLAAIRAQLAAAPSVQAGLSAMFRDVYDVSPTAVQLAALTNELATTTSYAQIQTQFTATAQSIVTGGFESVLDRAPTAAELASYTSRLTAGTIEDCTIYSDLAYSSASAANVTAMYQQVVGQAPPESMVIKLEQCLCIGEIPLVQLQTDLGTAQTLYQQITGQTVTAAALTPLMCDFLNHATMAQITLSLAHSAEENQFLASTYQSLFGYGITGSELQTLENSLQAGTTTMAAVETSLAAQAASEAPLIAATQATVTACYESVLDRSPTSAELASYTGLMINGPQTKTAVMSQLAYSAESTANVTAIYQQVIGQAPPASMVTTLEECLYIGSSPISLEQLPSDLGMAASLYQNITGQPVTANALNPLMCDLYNQASTAQISLWLAHSAQENQFLETSYQSIIGTPISGTELQVLENALQAGTTTMAAVLASLAAQAAADVPIVSSVVASQYDASNAAVSPFGALSITDPNPGITEHVTVSLTGGDGQLANGGAGLNAAGTLDTFSGTAAAVQGALRGLNLVNAAAGGTATLVVTVENAAGNSVSDTVVITTEALRQPTAAKLLFMPTGGDTVAATGGEAFVFPGSGFGQDTITSFIAATDLIELPKGIVATFANLQAMETSVAAGTMIGLGPSESIFLPGIAPSSLHASNFSFV